MAELPRFMIIRPAGWTKQLRQAYFGHDGFMAIG